MKNYIFLLVPKLCLNVLEIQLIIFTSLGRKLTTIYANLLCTIYKCWKILTIDQILQSKLKFIFQIRFRPLLCLRTCHTSAALPSMRRRASPRWRLRQAIPCKWRQLISENEVNQKQTENLLCKNGSKIINAKKV